MTPFHKWGVRPRLVLGFVGVLLPYVALVGMGAVEFQTLSKSVREMYEGGAVELQLVHAVRIRTNELTDALLLYGVSRDPAVRAEVDQRLSQFRAAVSEFVNRPSPAGPEERQLIEAVKGEAITIQALVLEVVAGEGGKTAQLLHRTESLKQALNRIETMGVQGIREERERISRVFVRMWIVTLGAVLLSLVGSVLLALLFSRWIAKPIEAIARASRAMTGGDLSQRVVSTTGGEAGETARVFNAMAERLEASHAALSRTNEELAAVNSIAGALTSSLELKQVFKVLTQRTAQAVGAERCSLNLWREGHVVPVMSQFADGHADPALWKKFRTIGPHRLEEVPVHAEAIRTRRPVAIEDATASHLYPAYWDVFGIRAALVVPLVRQDRVIGILSLDQTRGPYRWSQDQIDLAMTIASQAALAIENARLYEESETRRRSAEALAAVGHALAQSLDLAVVGQRITDNIRQHLRAVSSGLFRRGTRPGSFVLVAMSGDAGPGFEPNQVIMEEAGPIAVTMREGSPVSTQDLLADSRFVLRPEERALLGQAPFRAVLAVPLLAEGKVIGALAAGDRAGRIFDGEDIRMAQAFADQAAVALENARLYEESEARRRAAEALAAVGRDLPQSLDLAVVGQRITDSIRQLLGLAYSRLYRLEPESGDLVAVAVSGGGEPAFRGKLVFPKGMGAVGLAVGEGRLVVSEDVLADRRITLTPELRGRMDLTFSAVLAVPLVVKGTVIGALVVGDRVGRVYQAGETQLVQAFADQAAIALENARLVGDLKTRQASLEALQEVSRGLSAIQTPDVLLGKIAEACGRLLAVDSVGFRLVEGDDLVVNGTWGDAAEVMSTPRIKIGQSLTGLVAATGEPLIVPNLAEDPRLMPEHRGAVQRLGHRAWMGVPVKAGERLLGVLSIRTPREQGFTDEDLSMATAFASQASVALENARLFQEAQHALADLKAVQQQLVQSATMRALGELASGAAHHLNNLMAIVLGRVRLLLSGPESAPLRRPLEVIERAAMDAAEVVRRVSRFARMQPLEDWQPLDLRELASEVLELTRARWQDAAQAQGIRIEAVLEGSDVPPIVGNAAALREVLLNLMLNAVEALPEGGKIAVRTFSEEGWVGLAVSDTGVGMSQEVRERVLEPFFTTKGPRSTGLGLSESYGILQRHGGKLTIESAERHGTTVTIHLPAASALVEEATQPEPPRSGAPALSILVIDDDDEVREVVAEMLAAQGHTVLQATGGREGLALLEARERMDLVLTDLGMPEMNGWDVARAIRARWPGLPVGMLTGWGEQIDESSADRQMVSGILVKPATPESLQEFIAACPGASRGT